MSTVRRLAATAGGLAASRYVPPLPDEVHPVARFGQAMTAIEGRIWSDDREAGRSYAAAGVLLGALAGRLARSTAVTVALCAAGGQLRSTATDMPAGASGVAGPLSRSSRGSSSRWASPMRAVIPEEVGSPPDSHSRLRSARR